MLIGCECGGTFQVSKVGMTLQLTAKFGPYQLFMVDEHRCDQCSRRVYPVPPGQRVASEHFQDDFEAARSSAKSDRGLIELEAR